MLHTTRTHRIILIAICCLVTVVALAGCVRAQEAPPTQKLLGKWFDGKTGDEYDFVSDSLLVVPHAQAGGGNAVTYRLLDDNRLDIEAAGSHHVSNMSALTSDRLVLADPITGAEQLFRRDLAATNFAHSLESSVRVAVSDFATVTPLPDIVWVAKRPSGKQAAWTDWSTSTLTAYGTAWDWTTLKRDKTPMRTSGGGDAAGYSFTFTRPVPTTKELEQFAADSSIEASAGLDKIDVGYSASKTAYPAGTLVYLPKGLVYSLGDGFAIAVTLDEKNESFVPVTHR